MKPARFYIRRADGLAFPIPGGPPETDSEARAKGYADHWARVCKVDVEVRDLGDGSYTISWADEPGYIVYTAKAKSDLGIPLPRPMNTPPISGIEFDDPDLKGS
jgi:hypothetical protein